MLQYCLLAVLAVICGSANAAYSNHQSTSTFTGNYGNGANGGAGAGAAAGSGVYGSGAGHYSDKFPYANNAANFGHQQGQFPQFPFPQQPLQGNHQYQQFVDNFWKQFGQNYQNAATMTHATPGAHAYAYASAAPQAYSIDLYQQQLAYQQGLFNQFQHQQQQAGFGQNGFGQNGFYAPNFAGSSAAFGPNGVQQTAQIIPANPNSPNVDTRFGGDEPIVTVSAGPQGFQGVSTSSFSSSSDINGQKTSHREASTSVNDNGKVTTYTVRS